MDLSYLLELDSEDYYNCMLDMPWDEPPFDIRKSENKVHACASDVWVDVDENGTLYCYSTALFVRGLVVAMFSNIDVDRIQEYRLRDFDYIIESKVSQRRYRGLAGTLMKIQKIVNDKYISRGD